MIRFLLFTIAWVLLIPPLMEINENMRFTFYIYPAIILCSAHFSLRFPPR